MCRFNSGVRSFYRRISASYLIILLQFFYRHPLVMKYRYYWRVEYVPPYASLSFLSKMRYRPDVTFFCDLDYDPLLFMQDKQKVYGANSMACSLECTTNSALVQASTLPFPSTVRRLPRFGTL